MLILWDLTNIYCSALQTIYTRITTYVWFAHSRSVFQWVYINGMVDNIRVFFYFQLLSKMIVPTHIWSLALSVLNLVSRVALSDSSFKSRLPGKSANYLSWFYRKILDIRSKPKEKKQKQKKTRNNFKFIQLVFFRSTVVILKTIFKRKLYVIMLKMRCWKNASLSSLRLN